MKKLILIFAILTVTVFGQWIDDDFFVPGCLSVSDSTFSDTTEWNRAYGVRLAISDSAFIDTLEIGGIVLPDANDGVVLGASGNAFSDLFLASGAVVDFNSDITITHSANLLDIDGGVLRVDKLEVDGIGDYLDVSTDLDFVSTADMVLTPSGTEVHIVGGLSVGDETEVGNNNFKVVGTSLLEDVTTFTTAGITLAGADGVLTITGIGDGNDENLTFDFDNSNTNMVAISTGTGVTGIDFSKIHLLNSPSFNENLTYLYLDGTNDYVNLDLVAAELVNTSNTKGTIVWRGRIHDFITDNRILWSFGNLNIEEIIQFRVSGPNYKLEARCQVATVEQWVFATDNTFSEDVEYTFVLIQDASGAGVKLYVNEILEPTTFSVTTDYNSWFHETTGISNGYVGARNFAGGGVTNRLHCSVNYFDIWNYAWTVAEVEEFQNGNIPDKFQDVTQTLVVPSDDCDDDVINWTDINGTLTDNGTEYTYTVTTGASVATFTDEATLTIGKMYRATVLVKDGTGAGSTVRINALTNGDIVIENGTGITVAAGFAIATVEWEATEINNKVQIEIVAETLTDGQTVLFDEIECFTIGIFAEYAPDGIDIANSVWHDKQNGLDGIIVNATAHNMLVGMHVNKLNANSDDILASVSVDGIAFWEVDEDGDEFLTSSSWTDGTDIFKVNVASNKWTLWNDAGTPAEVMTVDSLGNVSFAKVITTEVEFAGNILLDPAVDGASYVDIANSGTGSAKLYIEGDQVNSDDLGDVADIGMLNENESVTGNWVNTTNPWADNEIVAFATGTKGDIHYASATNIWGELGVGDDNQMLVVATDVPNWETASSDLLSDVASVFMLDESETVYGNTANAAHTIVTLLNDDEHADTETSQTVDIVFQVKDKIGAAAYSNHEAFKMSIYKIADFFDATEASNDAGAKLYTVTDGAYVLNSTFSDDDLTVVGTISSALYGSDGSISDAELLNVDDATTVALAGLTIADVTIIEGTGVDAFNMVASGGINYILGSNAGNTALEFKTPANVLTQIGGQALDTDLTSLATPTAWRMFYSDAADPFIQEIVLGADGTFLESNGAAAAPAFRTLVDNDIPDGITITNISQVGDITATALEINTPLDGASVTLTEFQELETIDATTISANQWAALGGLAETLGSAEINILDGVTGVVAAEISYIGDVTGLIQAQLDLKAAIASPTFTTQITSPKVITSGNVGSVNTGVTAVEYGDAYKHTTVLTISQASALTVGNNESLADGYLLYTFPAGVVVIDYAYMTISINDVTEQSADQPDVGLGTVIATGAVATLDGTGTFEDIITGQPAADCNGTATLKTALPTANVPFIIESGDAHTLHFNIADLWATGATDLTADIAGTVVIVWSFLQ